MIEDLIGNPDAQDLELIRWLKKVAPATVASWRRLFQDERLRATAEALMDKS